MALSGWAVVLRAGSVVITAVARRLTGGFGGVRMGLGMTLGTYKKNQSIHIHIHIHMLNPAVNRQQPSHNSPFLIKEYDNS